MTIILPVSLHPKYFFIVLVVVVALQGDTLRSFLIAGAYRDMAHREAAFAQIVLVSAKHAIQNDYMVVVNSKHYKGRAGAIYVAEAHLMVQ